MDARVKLAHDAGNFVQTKRAALWPPFRNYEFRRSRPRGFARRRFRGLLLGLEILAGGLVDHLHRQPGLAAVVEAEQLYLDLVAFLDDVGGFLHAIRSKLRNMHEAVLG